MKKFRVTGIYPDYPDGGTFIEEFDATDEQDAEAQARRKMALSYASCETMEQFVEENDEDEVAEMLAESSNMDIIDVLDCEEFAAQHKGGGQ